MSEILCICINSVDLALTNVKKVNFCYAIGNEKAFIGLDFR